LISKPITAARAALAVLAVLSLWFAAGLKQDSDITSFIPEGEQKKAVALKNLVVSGNSAKTMIFALKCPKECGSKAGACLDKAGEELRKSGLFEHVATGVPADMGKVFFKTYFDSRFGLLSSQPEKDIPVIFNHAHLLKRFEKLRKVLALPSAMFMKDMVTRDPLLLFQSRMEMLEKEAGKKTALLCGKRFCSKDRRHLLLMARTKARPMDVDSQSKVLALAEKTVEKIRKEAGPGYDLEFTGINKFAVESSSRIKKDITLAMALSFIGVAALFLLFFKRVRFIPVVILPILFGMLVAVGVTQALFGGIHGLTLAFGSTLLGIGIDFPIHLLNHMMLDKKNLDDSRQARRSGRAGKSLNMSLFMGMFTTVLGFGAMALSSYPGVRQIALFSAVGVFSAFAFSIAFGPLARGLFRFGENAGLRQRQVFTDITRTIITFAWKRRRIIQAISVVLLVVSFVLSTGLKEEKDLRNLQAADPATLKQDKEIRSLLPASYMQLLLFTTSRDLEMTLRKNDGLYLDLKKLKASGRIKGFASLHLLLPSLDLQERNLKVLGSIKGLEESIREAMREEGIRPAAFGPFFKDLDGALSGKSPLVKASDLRSEPGLAMLLSSMLYIRENKKPVVVTTASTSNPGDDLSDVLPEGTTSFSEIAFVNHALSMFHKEASILILAGLLIIALAIFGYKRSILSGLASIAPALIAGVVTLALLALLGERINFLHISSLLLILCMGVDYGIFISDSLSARDEIAFEVALRSVILSALTTCFTFGVLAVCRNPALKAIGHTVGPGIVIAALLAIVLTPSLQGPGIFRQEEGIRSNR